MQSLRTIEQKRELAQTIADCIPASRRSYGTSQKKLVGVIFLRLQLIR